MKSIFHVISQALVASTTFTFGAAPIDLAGEWRLALDANDQGLATGPATWSFNDIIQFPNTLTLAGKAEPLALKPVLDKATLANLHQRFSFVGPAWYQRDVVVPPEWAKMDVRLELERVLWESRLWVNGKEAGLLDSLSTPHYNNYPNLAELPKYDGGALPPDKHTLTLRLHTSHHKSFTSLAKLYIR